MIGYSKRKLYNSEATLRASRDSLVQSQARAHPVRATATTRCSGEAPTRHMIHIFVPLGYTTIIDGAHPAQRYDGVEASPPLEETKTTPDGTSFPALYHVNTRTSFHSVDLSCMATTDSTSVLYINSVHFGTAKKHTTLAWTGDLKQKCFGVLYRLVHSYSTLPAACTYEVAFGRGGLL